LSVNLKKMSVFILGIESSCDDTSAAVCVGNKILANIIANQQVHQDFGGVVPELASRAHQQNIIPVIDKALLHAGIKKEQLAAVAFTNGPGLLGSLLVGSSFAKSFSQALNIPIIEVNHMQAHILANFIDDSAHVNIPEFPFLCMTVSGGHTQIMKVNSYFDMEIIGQTIDDAAGEAFDKAAKIMGIPYPGGPLIDKYAKEGNPKAFSFPKPRIPNFDFSFSGLKTSILYFLRDQLKTDSDFIEKNKNDLCASIQKTIVDILLDKLISASKTLKIPRVAIAGGVSANSALRAALLNQQEKGLWTAYIPKFEYTTDNAAMIAVTGYFKYIENKFTNIKTTPYTRYQQDSEQNQVIE